MRVGQEHAAPKALGASGKAPGKTASTPATLGIRGPAPGTPVPTGVKCAPGTPSGSGGRAPGTPSGSGSRAPGTPGGGRRDLPELKPAKRACFAAAAEAAESEQTKQEALEALRTDMSAASGRASACSLWTTWSRLHALWFQEADQVLPITPDKLLAVAACFKKGGYRAYPLYLSKAKEHHVAAGHRWDEQLELMARKTTASVTRGVGVTRQSAPFDFALALKVISEGRVPPVAGAPVGWSGLVVVATFFVMREIEVAFARAAHVTLCSQTSKATLALPVSKKDPQAVGCARSWDCICKSASSHQGPRPDCPYHALMGQLGLLCQQFGEPLPEGLPLFPTECGGTVAKTAVVAMLEATVLAYGAPVVGPSGARLYGGHSFRVTGAQKLSALGVDTTKIMVLARWAGESVLRYIRDAPLANLTAEVVELEAKRSVLGAIEDLHGELKAVSRGIEEQKAANEEAIQGLRRQMAAQVDKPYVANCGRKRFKVHAVAVGDRDVLPQLWKTKCGAKFGQWSFTRHGELHTFPEDTLCSKCFRVQVAASASSSSASSEGSGVEDT